MDVVYPPVGISHITRQIPDLIADRMPTAREIRLACAMQPKAAPHFGTGIVILTAFALARLLRDTFGKPASVLLDMLDNAPAQTSVIDGVEYSLCLSHAIDGGHSTADINTEPVRQLAAWASQQAAISFRVRRYSEIQAQPDFRLGLADVLSHPEMFVPLFSPSEHRLRIRPLCPRCGLVDKTARTVQVRQGNALALTFQCGNHGSQTVHLADHAAVIDANAPIRTVLRSLCFSRDRDTQGIETIVVNGGDWAGAWMQRVYFDGLHQLGCCGPQRPLQHLHPADPRRLRRQALQDHLPDPGRLRRCPARLDIHAGIPGPVRPGRSGHAVGGDQRMGPVTRQILPQLLRALPGTRPSRS